MTTSPELPELVLDSRLAASFHPDEFAPRKITHRRHLGRGRIQDEIWRRARCLGGGGYGMVWLENGGKASGQRTRTRAVKEIRTRGKKMSREGYTRELEALAKFSQAKYVDFFVRSFGWFESQESLFIAMEYCEHGDLKKYLEVWGQLPETQAQDISWQLVQGLVFMHENGFAHRDLKPANILIRGKPPESHWHVKICDLGLSKRIEGDVATTTVKGTPGFMPPETLFDFPGAEESPRKIDPFAGDMWCLGETIFHILTSQPTFHNSLGGLMQYAKSGQGFPSVLPEKVGASERAVQFLQELMKSDPPTRLTAVAALRHPWILANDNDQDACENETSGSEVSNMNGIESQSRPTAESTGGESASAAWTVTGAARAENEPLESVMASRGRVIEQSAGGSASPTSRASSMSINNPDLLEPVEYAVRRLTMSDIDPLKREQNKRDPRRRSFTSSDNSVSHEGRLSHSTEAERRDRKKNFSNAAKGGRESSASGADHDFIPVRFSYAREYGNAREYFDKARPQAPLEQSQSQSQSDSIRGQSTVANSRPLHGATPAIGRPDKLPVHQIRKGHFVEGEEHMERPPSQWKNTERTQSRTSSSDRASKAAIQDDGAAADCESPPPHPAPTRAYEKSRNLTVSEAAITAGAVGAAREAWKAWRAWKVAQGKGQSPTPQEQQRSKINLPRPSSWNWNGEEDNRAFIAADVKDGSGSNASEANEQAPKSSRSSQWSQSYDSTRSELEWEQLKQKPTTEPRPKRRHARQQQPPLDKPKRVSFFLPESFGRYPTQDREEIAEASPALSPLFSKRPSRPYSYHGPSLTSQVHDTGKTPTAEPTQNQTHPPNQSFSTPPPKYKEPMLREFGGGPAYPLPRNAITPSEKMESIAKWRADINAYYVEDLIENQIPPTPSDKKPPSRRPVVTEQQRKGRQSDRSRHSTGFGAVFAEFLNHTGDGVRGRQRERQPARERAGS